MVLARSIGRFFSILGFWVHLIVFGEQQTNEMATFVAKNSGGVEKKPMTTLKDCFFSF